MTMIQDDQAAATKEVPRRRSRLRWSLVATGGLTVAVVAGVLITGAPQGDKPTPDTQIPATEAARVLQLAAATAAEKPALTARPDQFVFIESFTVYSLSDLGAPKPPEPANRQTWHSVDGTRDGLLRTQKLSTPGNPHDMPLDGCINGRMSAGSTDRPCQPQPAFRTDLPTTADAMFTWLYANSEGDNPRDVQAFMTVGGLIREAYLPPAALSALFTAASRIPGVTVNKDAKDVSGRPGIGVMMPAGSAEIVFDPNTYEYLGERVHGTAGVVHGASRIRLAIVDNVGQLPNS